MKWQEMSEKKKKQIMLLIFVNLVLIMSVGILIAVIVTGGKGIEDDTDVKVAVSSEKPDDNSDSAEDGAEPEEQEELAELGGEPVIVPFSYTPRSYDTDSKGNLIIPDRQEGSFEACPEFEPTFIRSGDTLLDEAEEAALMYDYDKAIKILKKSDRYEKEERLKKKVKEYKKSKSKLKEWEDNTQVTHIFFHSLVVDTSLAFADSNYKAPAYNEVMTTVDEFVTILNEMYERGYVLVDIHDVARYVTDDDGNRKMKFQPIMLPEGKIPFVLSQDDVSYYEYMDGHGFATKLVIGEDGRITNEYITKDGETVYGSYDMVPIVDDFVEAHPDFSYHGAKGIIALTGYEGILGYRTNEGDEKEMKKASEVAEAMKKDGWTFASHSWGHKDLGENSADYVKRDTDRWNTEVAPLIGGTDVIIYPKGADIHDWTAYPEDGTKFQILKSYGFDYFCNVDSARYWVQMSPRGDYMRMGRRNIDGTRLWQAISYFADPDSYSSWSEDKRYSRALIDIIDARTVFDWSRPMPVT